MQMRFNLGTDNLKNTQLFIVGWASRPPVAEGGQDAIGVKLRKLESCQVGKIQWLNSR